MISFSNPNIRIVLNVTVIFLSVFIITRFTNCVIVDGPVKIIQANSGKNLYPILTEYGIVLTSTCGSLPAFVLVNPDDGQAKWEWCDTIDAIDNSYYNLTPYVFQNYLTIPGRNLLLIIDLASGRTHQVLELNGSLYPHLTGSGGEVYFVVKSEEDPRHSISYSFDLHSNRLTEINDYYFNSTSTNVLTSPVLIDTDSGTFLQSSIDYRKGELTNSYFTVWQDSREEEMCIRSYPDNQKGHGVSRIPILSEDSLFSYWQSTDGLVSFSHASLKVEWELILGVGILTSRVEKFGDNLIYPSEGGAFYLIDTKGGTLLDSIDDMPGTPGRLSVIELEKPIIYFTGGSDGRLYKIEMGKSMSVMPFRFVDFRTGEAKELSRQSIFTPAGFCVLAEGEWFCGGYERFSDLFKSI